MHAIILPMRLTILPKKHIASRERDEMDIENQQQENPIDVYSCASSESSIVSRDFSTESESNSSSHETNDEPNRFKTSGHDETLEMEHKIVGHSPQEREDRKHFMWFTHGKLWTMLAIVFAWTGLLCSFQARDTTSFASLEYPIFIDTSYEEVYDVGMVNVQLCLNKTHTGIDDCAVHALGVDSVSDKMFQLARSMAFLAILLGGFLAASITLAVFWSSINLRPVGIGFLITYFLQSLTFLFYDSDLCASHSCHMSKGTAYSIAGSFCWIFAAVASARMDNVRYQQEKARSLFEEKGNIGILTKPSNLNREQSDITQQTASSHHTCSTEQDQEEHQPRRNYPTSRISTSKHKKPRQQTDLHPKHHPRACDNSPGKSAELQRRGLSREERKKKHSKPAHSKIVNQGTIAREELAMLRSSRDLPVIDHRKFEL